MSLTQWYGGVAEDIHRFYEPHSLAEYGTQTIVSNDRGMVELGSKNLPTLKTLTWFWRFLEPNSMVWRSCLGHHRFEHSLAEYGTQTICEQRPRNGRSRSKNLQR